MSIEELLQNSEMERQNLKSQMYDAQRRILELDNIIAALKRAKEVVEMKSDESAEG